MKLRWLGTLMAMAALWTGCASPPRHIQWEYKILSGFDFVAGIGKVEGMLEGDGLQALCKAIERVLNDLGKEGWEVVHVQEKSNDWLFKRQVPK